MWRRVVGNKLPDSGETYCLQFKVHIFYTPQVEAAGSSETSVTPQKTAVPVHAMKKGIAPFTDGDE
jgi:hypothetical protein